GHRIKPSDWNDAGWQQLGMNQSWDTEHALELSNQGERIVIRATGDVDCDGHEGIIELVLWFESDEGFKYEIVKRGQIEGYQEPFPERWTVFYGLDKPPENIDESSPDAGPPNTSLLRTRLDDLGWQM
ncbi:MAG: hypothetical protein JJ974_12950, partial [Phycisphaerales bacterium]|nr:hypothetical protein [Phycisphaerales bacterium]